MFGKKRKLTYDSSSDDEPLVIRKKKSGKHQRIENLEPIEVSDSDGENTSGTGKFPYKKSVDSTVSIFNR